MNKIDRTHIPDWVQVQKRNGLYVAMMDCINHPLNEEKSNVQLNTIVTYYRQPDYPFWVKQSNFAKKPFVYPAEVEIYWSMFVGLLSTGKDEEYTNFCLLWDGSSNAQRKLLLKISKHL